MTSSIADNAQAGFATVAATGLSLTIGLIAAAVVGRMAGEFGAARSEYLRRDIEYQLTGVQQLAAFKVASSGGEGPFAWRTAASEGDVQMLAEAEAGKMSLGAAAENLDSQTLERLGVVDGVQLRERLRLLATRKDVSMAQIAAADSAPLWRACAPSLLSPYGAGRVVSFRSATPLSDTGRTSHVGEVWRVRAVSRSGWSDDRLVRFTGSAERSAAVVERRFSRIGARAGQCTATMGAGGS